MNKIIFFLFLFCYLHGSAQFAIINDEDGYVNVREDGSKNSKVVDKLNNGHLICCIENKGNWINIDYILHDKERNGYLYKKKFKMVSDCLSFPATKKSDNKIVFKKDSISVTLTSTAFEKKKHRFKYVKDSPDQILLIDNKKYWGKDGGTPSTQFDKIIIEIGKTILLLPKAALEGLYEPNLFSAEINYDKENNILYIQTMNSDGAGSYEVIWKIEKGEYKERLVAYGF
jgi:hypothetical protein